MTTMWSRAEAIDWASRVASEVVAAGGIATRSLRDLRDLDGSGRAGHLVRRRISKALNAEGIECLPRELPADQDALIYLYSLKTDAGRVLAGALRLAELSAARDDFAAVQAGDAAPEVA